MDILDADIGEMTLRFDGRTVTTIQSLSELTSAMAFRRCDDKAHPRQVLGRAGLAVPDGRLATFDDGDVDFLRRCGDIVVKPTRGEGGAGVCVGITDPAGLADALVTAAAVYPTVLMERLHDGHDLRIIVIGDEVVAASVRRPPTVTGTGSQTVGELVDELNAERGVHDDEEHHPMWRWTPRRSRRSGPRASSPTAFPVTVTRSRSAVPPTCTPAAPSSTSPTSCTRSWPTSPSGRPGRSTSRCWGST